MTSKTLRERFIAALEAVGEKQVTTKSSRYITFTRQAGGFYFVGKSGALRWGYSSSNAAKSSRRDYSMAQISKFTPSGRCGRVKQATFQLLATRLDPNSTARVAKSVAFKLNEGELIIELDKSEIEQLYAQLN